MIVKIEITVDVEPISPYAQISPAHEMRLKQEIAEKMRMRITGGDLDRDLDRDDDEEELTSLCIPGMKMKFIRGEVCK